MVTQTLDHEGIAARKIELARRFGSWGLELHDLCRGIDQEGESLLVGQASHRAHDEVVVPESGMLAERASCRGGRKGGGARGEGRPAHAGTFP